MPEGAALSWPLSDIVIRRKKLVYAYFDYDLLVVGEIQSFGAERAVMKSASRRKFAFRAGNKRGSGRRLEDASNSFPHLSVCRMGSVTSTTSPCTKSVLPR